MKVGSGIIFKTNLSQQNNEIKELYLILRPFLSQQNVLKIKYFKWTSRPYGTNQNLKHLSGQKMIYLKWQTQIRVLDNMGHLRMEHSKAVN